jgi:hypothetical protein
MIAIKSQINRQNLNRFFSLGKKRKRVNNDIIAINQ